MCSESHHIHGIGEMFSLDKEAELAMTFTGRSVSVEMSSVMLNTEYVSHLVLLNCKFKVYFLFQPFCIITFM